MRRREPVVVVVFTHKPTLTGHEEIALRQCWRILQKHPIRLVCPKGMDTSEYRRVAPGIVIDEIAPSWLSSVRAYNRLKINAELYDRYQKYDFLLTYELDAFVFRDELLEWCAAGWDYVGAPWFEQWDKAPHDAAMIPGGNSGFSLRRIDAARRVLRSVRMLRSPREVFRAWRHREGMSITGMPSLLGGMTYRNLFHSRFNGYSENEDIFWSVVVPSRFPWFSVADNETASRFSFEVRPERLFRSTGERLPFGCHKWDTHNFPFWRPIIEAHGYDLHMDTPLRGESQS